MKRQDLQRLLPSTWCPNPANLDQLQLNDTNLVVFYQLLQQQARAKGYSTIFIDPLAMHEHSNGFFRRTKVRNLLFPIPFVLNRSLSQNLDISDADFVIFPVHLLSSQHWVLYVHDTKKKTLKYYDSALPMRPPDTIPASGKVEMPLVFIFTALTFFSFSMLWAI